MARDKAKDDKYFNCSQEHEINYVSGLYAKSSEIKSFLIIQCRNGKINNMPTWKYMK